MFANRLLAVGILPNFDGTGGQVTAECFRPSLVTHLNYLNALTTGADRISGPRLFQKSVVEGNSMDASSLCPRTVERSWVVYLNAVEEGEENVAAVFDGYVESLIRYLEGADAENLVVQADHRWTGDAAALRFQHQIDTRSKDFSGIDFQDIPAHSLEAALTQFPKLFVFANLQRANLKAADLFSADLTGANTEGAIGLNL
ncbi:MAG: hypothetical protein COX62_03740 [Deltaproteobacteria bacterium CG_4_10_14_0_2_um_filter_43_8]|nr:MAG: hypothetical protein COV43_00020 [Deltaproteobacteria bacterium CG11_big_fil_rev_8_21_14_0_20_42_23]PJA20956.1 MAG: hypothetical protein COX62_03740 [Deltaproteobacteria bacterium CG_4_10_14_0_2_um_filter_43_8]PJC64974.1 MAG: hypothetical protein CO021_01525 [Deltaproteobacteria bacterium CG_4_9_14_0_2_um_filter_42_21]